MDRSVDQTAVTTREPIPRPVCLTDGCNHDGAIRGLCGTCYSTALKLVKLGETSWGILERIGLSAPPKPRRPRTVTRFERGMIDRMRDAGIASPGPIGPPTSPGDVPDVRPRARTV